MGRRANNPDLVEELIENRWNADYEYWDEKCESLSSSDMSEVAGAIGGMEDEFMSDDFDTD